MTREGRTDLPPPVQLGCLGQAAVVAMFLAILLLATL